MKLSKISFTALLLWSLSSHAIEIQSARIDGRSGVMYLDILADCNIQHPVIRPEFHSWRPDSRPHYGPRYYRLDFRQTEIGCLGRPSMEKTVKLKLPDLPAGQSVAFRYGTTTLRYRTSVPQTDQDVEIQKSLKPIPMQPSNPEVTR